MHKLEMKGLVIMKYPNTKLGKYDFLKKNKEFTMHLPYTCLMTADNMKLLLNENRTVFAKPNNGFGGFGVVQIKKLNDSRYRTIHSDGTRSILDTFDDMYTYMTDVSGDKIYVAQKGIDLLQYQKRPFDIRIMVQKNKYKEWETTGILGRLAKPSKVITNFMNGGKIYPLDQLLSSYLDQEDRDLFIKSLEDLGQQVAVYMSSGYPTFHSYGVDIGLSSDLKPWIIEVNTRPGTIVFKHLKDKAMYQKIMKYSKRNGTFPF